MDDRYTFHILLSEHWKSGCIHYSTAGSINKKHRWRERAEIGRAEIERADIERVEIERVEIDRTEIERTDIERAEIERAHKRERK